MRGGGRLLRVTAVVAVVASVAVSSPLPAFADHHELRDSFISPAGTPGPPWPNASGRVAGTGQTWKLWRPGSMVVTTVGLERSTEAVA